MTDQSTTVYVALLGEGVDVWRPILAELVQDDTYRIADQPYDPATETWEFLPGDVVRCGPIQTSDGKVLAAKALASDPTEPGSSGSLRIREP